jgi:putative endonuclease
MYYVYVIKSKTTDKIYIGQTSDLGRRLSQHNDRNLGKRSYTKLQGDNWEIIYKEEFITRVEAVNREKQLKSYRGREFIKKKLAGR